MYMYMISYDIVSYMYTIDRLIIKFRIDRHNIDNSRYNMCIYIYVYIYRHIYNTRIREHNFIPLLPSIIRSRVTHPLIDI